MKNNNILERNKRNGAHVRAVVLALGWLISRAGVAHELSGELNPQGDSLYENYAYEVYEIEMSGEKLAVSINATADLDPYLILCSPETMCLTDDDGGEGSNSRIEVPETSAGRWIAIATSRWPFARGSYSVVVDGSSYAAHVASENVNAELVEAAFAARDVIRQEATHRRRIQLLKDQLTLRSFREGLIQYLTHVAAASEDSSTREYAQVLEARKGQLLAAIDEIDSLEASQDFVRGLLEEKLSSTEASLSDLYKENINRVSRRENYVRALDSIRALEEVLVALQQLKQSLLHSERDESVDVHKTQSEIAQLRIAVDKLAESISVRLLESIIIQQLSFNVIRFQPLEDEILDPRFVSLGHASLDTAMERDILIEDGGIDVSVWLPELFPWPPPVASSRIVLDRDLIPDWHQRMTTLGDVDDVLNKALSAAGYDGPSYFGVKDGFALITQLEQTHADGVPLDKGRFSTGIAEMKAFSWFEYLRALLTAPRGYYRVLAFITTSIPFSTSKPRGQFATIEAWSRAGHNFLPESVRTMPYSKDHRVTVLVYEFSKKTETDDPFTSVPGRLTAREHLERSALLANLR